MAKDKILAESAKDFTLELLFKIVDGYGYIKPHDIPLCIIKYGPPGSGKTSADARIENLFKIKLRNFAKIDKDSPLIAINDFRSGSIDIIKRYEGLAYQTQPAQKKVVGLQERILSEKNSDGLSIVDKIPIVLQRAFDHNLNILWETTCQSAGSQKLMDLAFKTIPKHYRIIVVFPIVSLKTAKQRVLERAEAHLSEEFPYYRPVPASQVKRATIQSHKYFKEHILPKVLDGSIYQLFCYNNEKSGDSNTYKVIKNTQIQGRRTRRIAPGWSFGLNKKGSRTIIKDGRKTRKA